MKSWCGRLNKILPEKSGKVEIGNDKNFFSASLRKRGSPRITRNFTNGAVLFVPISVIRGDKNYNVVY